MRPPHTPPPIKVSHPCSIFTLFYWPIVDKCFKNRCYFSLRFISNWLNNTDVLVLFRQAAKICFVLLFWLFLLLFISFCHFWIKFSPDSKNLNLKTMWFEIRHMSGALFLELFSLTLSSYSKPCDIHFVLNIEWGSIFWHTICIKCCLCSLTCLMSWALWCNVTINVSWC